MGLREKVRPPGMRGEAELAVAKNVSVNEGHAKQEADPREDRQESPGQRRSAAGTLYIQPYLNSTGVQGSGGWRKGEVLRMRMDRLPSFLQDSCVQQSSPKDLHLTGEETWVKEVEVCHIPVEEITCDDIKETEENATQPHEVVLRRPAHGLWLLGGRRALSMFVFPDDQRTQQGMRNNHQERFSRPHSVCMLAAANSCSLSPPASFPNSQGCPDVFQRCRTRRAELRVIDGIKPDMPPSFNLLPHTQEEPPIRRSLKSSGKPRPVSMTVLELKEYREELTSHTSTSSLPRPGFRWKWFGRQTQLKDEMAVQTSVRQKEPVVSKAEVPKTTFGSLRRTLSLRIRRNRNQAEQEDRTGRRRTSSIGEKSMQSAHPFSYLTGRTLAPTHEQDEEQGATQYIQFQTRGKLSVMEVPLRPAKLTQPTKQTPSEPSFWQLIANRFRKKEPLSGNRSEVCSESQTVGSHPPARNKKSDSVAIGTPPGTGFHKGQGKLCKMHKFRPTPWVCFVRRGPECSLESRTN